MLTSSTRVRAGRCKPGDKATEWQSSARCNAGGVCLEPHDGSELCIANEKHFPTVAPQSKPQHLYMYSRRRNRRYACIFPSGLLIAASFLLLPPFVHLFLIPSSSCSSQFPTYIDATLVGHYSSLFGSSANSAMMSCTQMSLSSCEVSTRNTVSFLSQGLAASCTTSSWATRGFFSTWFLKTMEASSDHCLGFSPAKRLRASERFVTC